jgi:hypothetical protein
MPSKTRGATIPPYQNTNRGFGSSSLGSGIGLTKVNYQVVGAGSKPCSAWFDPFVVSDPATTLRALLGPLARCDVADPWGLSPTPSAELPVETPQDPVSLEPWTKLRPPIVGLGTVRRTGLEPLQLVVCVGKPELGLQRGMRTHDEFRQMHARPREDMPSLFHMPRGPPVGACGLQPKSMGNP